MAAASVVAFKDSTGTTASWQYDNVLLVMTGLNVVVPQSAPTLHLLLSIQGIVMSRDCAAGFNQLIVAPSAPTISAVANGIAIAGVDFIGGTMDGQMAKAVTAVV